jgi:hypothetical protein
MVQETIATTVRKTYASATATSTAEGNRVKEVQQQNLKRRVQ